MLSCNQSSLSAVTELNFHFGLILLFKISLVKLRFADLECSDWLENLNGLSE